MKSTLNLAFLVSLFLLLGFAGMAQSETPKLYDPNQDVRADIKKSLAIAKKDNKHVLLQVGGNW